MSETAIFPLATLTAAASVAVLLVAILRLPVRRLVGAQAAYWLWLMVPAGTLACMLPAPAQSLRLPEILVPTPIGHALAAAIAAWSGLSAPMFFTNYGSTVWALGAIAMVWIAVRRQRRFVLSLGRLALLPNGAYRSETAGEPMLVGALRPRVVVPADFESRYTEEERNFVIAHERAHQQRGDALANALATGWLCLCWFHPLMYWAVERFRFDQELACDATVLQSTRGPRRRYAHALLKTQLADGAADIVASAAPFGAQWQSAHPLRERIRALTRPLPGSLRHAAGVVLALGLIGGGTYSTWAVQVVPKLASATPASQMPMQAQTVIPQAVPQMVPSHATTVAQRCKGTRTSSDKVV
jgi:beta-lactamase regulating signal transducer with metallopeptidase domain